MSTKQATATSQFASPPPAAPAPEAPATAGPAVPGAVATAPPPTGEQETPPTVSYALEVDAEGRVVLPGTRPGDLVRVTVAVIEPVQASPAPGQVTATEPEPEPDPAAPEATLPASPATANEVPIHLRTPEEKAAIMAEVLAAGRRVRETSSDYDRWRAINHGDWLYDENGLPK